MFTVRNAQKVESLQWLPHILFNTQTIAMTGPCPGLRCPCEQIARHQWTFTECHVTNITTRLCLKKFSKTSESWKNRDGKIVSRQRSKSAKKWEWRRSWWLFGLRWVFLRHWCSGDQAMSTPQQVVCAACIKLMLLIMTKQSRVCRISFTASMLWLKKHSRIFFYLCPISDKLVNDIKVQPVGNVLCGWSVEWQYIPVTSPTSCFHVVWLLRFVVDLQKCQLCIFKFR